MSSNIFRIISRRLSTSVKEKLQPSEFLPTIGLEVHAQVNSKSKLFSAARNVYQSPPNSLVALFDAAIPGTLPVVNRKVVEAAILTSLALNCKINYVSSFDRKHYFYGDLPLGFQITQQERPIGVDGFLEFTVYNDDFHDHPYNMTSKIKQIQIEQDSGKSFHDDVNRKTLVDLNRAGVPLLEIVFEPDLKDGYEAACLVGDLIHLLKAIDTCECKMEEGTLRVDANISVRPRHQIELGTRTEVKNLNSMTSITKAIDFEISRQFKLLQSGESIVNETMRFDSTTGKTVVMRDKEIVMDYRFMPEGNLPLLILKDSYFNINQELFVPDVHDFRKILPPSPIQVRQSMMEKYGLNAIQVLNLFESKKLRELFELIVQEKPSRDPSSVCRTLMEILPDFLKETKQKLAGLTISWRRLGELSDLIQDDKVSSLTAFDLLQLDSTGDNRSFEAIVRENNWYKITDPEEVTRICSHVGTLLPKRVKTVHQKGGMFAFQALVGLCIKMSQRKIDQKVIEEKLIELIKPPGGKILSQKKRLKQEEETQD